MAVETMVHSERASAARSSGALVVQDLVRRYGERTALAGVSLSLGRGETLVVFGPNGAGKTTLLRVLATLLLPHGGSVRTLGHDLPREAHAARSRIGLVAHEPLLYRDLSGRENLRFYARLYDVADAEERIEELLRVVQMPDRGDDPIRELSRGLVQRLAVCRAVLHRPELLLLDEPRAGLDPDAIELIEPLIGRAAGATRVLVSHDVEAGRSEADRVLGLRSGNAVLSAAATATDPAEIRFIYRDRP